MLRMLIGPARCRLVAGVLDFPVVATRGLWRRTLEHLRVRQFTLDFSGNRAPPLWCKRGKEAETGEWRNLPDRSEV